MSSSSCSVLIVDDAPDEAARALEQSLMLAKVKCNVRHPADVDETDLRDADLVLVDYQIEDWPSRDDSSLELGLRPPDGIALKSTLRRHASRIDKASPTAFAILTGRMSTLANPLPAENREHILSFASGLEWVFSKNESNLVPRIRNLGSAVKALPRTWSSSGTNELNSLLAVSKARPNWREQLTEEAMRCLPPVHELRSWSHGLAFIRWMLQRILPYPTFLVETKNLAARLGVDPAQLMETLSDERSSLRVALRPCEYKGILAGFSGPRWWRIAIESLLWEKTKGKSFNIEDVHQYLASASGLKLAPSNPRVNPVVCYDENFRPLSQLGSIDSSVRVRPDDWPAYAEDAWATIEDVENFDSLRAVVLSDDLYKLEAQ